MDPLVRKRSIQTQRERVVLDAARRDEEPDRHVVQPPDRELQNPGRRKVEPLHVVDRQHQGTRHGKGYERTMERGRKGPAIRRGGGGLHPEQRHLEGGSLRWRERIERFVDDPLEEISEAGDGEPRLGLRGPRRKCAVGEGPSLRQGVEPQGALADARFAPEDQGLRPGGDGIEERRDTGELGLPAEPGALHRLLPRASGSSWRARSGRSRRLERRAPV
jgi:hypothetical protein